MKLFKTNSILIFVFCLMGSLSGGCQSRPTAKVVINEICTSNWSTGYDDVGMLPDWIELYNQSDDTLNLEGFFMTDDLENKIKYAFGDEDTHNTEILPKSHLHIWAGSDSNSTEARADFKLSSKDGIVALIAPDSVTVLDIVKYEKQYGDVSYGRVTDAGAAWTYIYPSTPGEPNPEKKRKDRSEKVKFSHKGGLFDAPFVLTLSSEKGKIIYTLNGTLPHPGEESLEYTEPIKIDSGMVVRARVLEDDKIPGPITTNTFLIGERSRLPIVCVTVNPDNFFSSSQGLMRGRNSDEPWEYPSHAEYFLPDGTVGFDQGFGIRLFGFYGKTATKKSFVLRCRGKYGKKKIKYKLFADKDIDEFDGIILRADATYAIRRTVEGRQYAGERVKNELIYNLIKQMDSPLAQELQGYQHVVMFLNGRYFGLYTLTERKASDFIESNFGIKKAEIINPFFKDVNRGSMKDWYEVMDYIDTNDLADPEVWAYMEQRFHMTEFVDHWILEAWTSKGDGNRNTRLWREDVPGSQWHTIPYDWDHWKGPRRDNISRMYEFDEIGKSALFRPFTENKDFYNFFHNRYSDWLNTVLTYQNVSATVDSVFLQSADEQPRDREFWTKRGQTYTEVQDQRDWIKDFALEKGFWIRDQCREVLGAGDARKVILNTNTGTGSIKISTLEIDQFPWTGVYFEGIPIEITAIPPAGHRFASWSLPDMGDQASTVIELKANTEITANFEPIK